MREMAMVIPQKVDNKKVKTLSVTFDRPYKQTEEVDPKAQKGKPVKK